MKQFFNTKWLALILMGMMCVGFTACGDDDDEIVPEQPKQVVDTTTIVAQNNSSYSFYDFTFIFLNDKSNNGGEVVSTRDCGTLDMGESVSAKIPSGATYYYIYMEHGGTEYVSADYPVSVTNLSIDNNFRWYY